MWNPIIFRWTNIFLLIIIFFPQTQFFLLFLKDFFKKIYFSFYQKLFKLSTLTNLLQKYLHHTDSFIIIWKILKKKITFSYLNPRLQNLHHIYIYTLTQVSFLLFERIFYKKFYVLLNWKLYLNSLILYSLWCTYVTQVLFNYLKEYFIKNLLFAIRKLYF